MLMHSHDGYWSKEHLCVGSSLGKVSDTSSQLPLGVTFIRFSAGASSALGGHGQCQVTF